MARTQAERKIETRARLLDAAAALFAERGFHAVSTDTVADAAERTSGAVYAHFGGKEGLLLALLDRWENETASAVGQAIGASAGGVRDRFRALWQTFVAPAEEGEPDGLLLEHELWLYGARHPETATALAHRYSGARVAIARSIDVWATEDGTPPPQSSEHRAALVMALLLGLEMQRRIDPTAVPDDVAIDGLTALLDHATTRPQPTG